jgi:hypothetical protein
MRISLDLAPMDHEIYRNIKWAVFNNNAYTIAAFIRAMTSASLALDQNVINASLRCWQDQVKLMTESDGHHIKDKLASGRFGTVILYQDQIPAMLQEVSDFSLRLGFALFH